MTLGLPAQGAMEARELSAFCVWGHNATIAAHNAIRAMKRLGFFTRSSYFL
jgi:hypothetical protein